MKSMVLKVLLSLTAGITACSAVGGGIDDVDTSSESTGRVSDGLYYLKNSVWASPTIPVCWETSGNDVQKRLVRDAVQSTWSASSRLQFTGWGPCAPNARGIRIRTADEWPSTRYLGKQNDGVQNAMILNFWFNFTVPDGDGGTYQPFSDCQNGSGGGTEYCIKAIGVHEFGHAIGLSHEQNRPDTDRTACKKAPQGTDGDTTIGDWDPQSVMNYCNSSYNNDGYLSARDAIGVQQIYGLPAAASVKSVCRSSPTAASHPTEPGHPPTKLIRSDLAAPWDNSGTTSVGLYPSNGSSFGFGQSLTQGGWDNRSKYASGDFNADGVADIATIWPESGSATIAVRASTGTTFSLATWGQTRRVFLDSSEWLPGDFNGDHKVDLAVAWNDHGQTSVGVFLSNGSSFGSYQSWAVRLGGWDDGYKWTVGDFNNDGLADLVTVWPNGQGQNAITIRRSTGSSFALQLADEPRGGWIPTTKWLTGDFNGDGYTDLAAAWNESGTARVAVYASNGTGFPSWAPWDNTGGGWMNEAEWTTGDFDGDGKWDLATAWPDGFGRNVLTVRKSNGSSFGQQEWLAPGHAGGWIPTTQWCAGKFTR